jgi:hypothetical protein
VDYIVTELLLLGVVRWEQGTDKKINSHMQRSANERMEEEQRCPLVAPADMIGSRRVAWIEWRSGPPNPNPDQFLPIPTTCVGSPQDASRRPGAKIPGAESAGNASVVVAANPFRDER